MSCRGVVGTGYWRSTGECRHRGEVRTVGSQGREGTRVGGDAICRHREQLASAGPSDKRAGMGFRDEGTARGSGRQPQGSLGRRIASWGEEDPRRPVWQIGSESRRGRKSSGKDQEGRSHGSSEADGLTRRAQDGCCWACRGLETRGLWLAHMDEKRRDLRRGSLNAVLDDGRPEAEQQEGEREGSSVGGGGGANGCDGRREWVTWWFGRRLMAAGGQSGGLGCKEEKFAASKMVLSRRPQSQSTRLLIRRMGAEARLSPVPACGPPFTLATTPERNTHTHTHTQPFGGVSFFWYTIYIACLQRILNHSNSLESLFCFSFPSYYVVVGPQRERLCVCVCLGRFRKNAPVHFLDRPRKYEMRLVIPNHGSGSNPVYCPCKWFLTAWTTLQRPNCGCATSSGCIR